MYKGKYYKSQMQITNIKIQILQKYTTYHNRNNTFV